MERLKKIKNSRSITCDNLTPDVIEYIDWIRREFREDLIRYPECNSVWYLLRFLRARDFEAPKVKIMLRNFFDFRDEKDMERIRKKVYPDHLLRD